MKTTLTVADLKNIMTVISDCMEENKDYLCKLDGALGDGDLGLTMSKGFKAIKNHLSKAPGDDIGVLLMQSGLEMANAAASTMGTLMATGLMRAGKVSQGKNELALGDMVIAVNAMVDGIKERGKASVGDKTILDSIYPAFVVLKETDDHGGSLEAAIQAAYQAADKGMNETKQMQSKQGRAARYLEKSIGHIDPGATVGALFFKGFADYFNTVGKSI